MKKVLLVTLQGANLGNRLQNYALQTVLEKMGIEISTPVYQETSSCLVKIKLLVKNILAFLGNKKYNFAILQEKRSKAFEEFSEKYIHNRIKVTFDSVYSKDWSEYKYAITGSDQVWHNWSNTKKELEYFYLMFMPKEKRISYAPSFGFTEFPQADISTHKKGLEEMRCLSCREENGKNLIFNLTKKKAELLIDPVFLLKRKEWEKIEKRPDYVLTEPYMVVYFLGNETEEYVNAYNKIAKECNLKVIDIFNQDIVEYYYTTPDEFLWLIHHAECVCTDSFHACAFSIMYHKKFKAFKRSEVGMENMFGRIETLLATFGLTDLIYEKNDEKCPLEIDYASVDEKLEVQRRQSEDFLVKSLEL